MTTIMLKASDLARKSGFIDGDAVAFMVERLEDSGAIPGIEARVRAFDAPRDVLDKEGYPGHTGDHKILVALVRRHLAPLLPGVEILDYFSAHNPVRCGAEHADLCAASRVSVTLGREDLIHALDALEAAPCEAAPSP